jgi:hypothetical protein
MRRAPLLGFLALLAALGTVSVVPALADDACGGYKWDVSRERALFATSPVAVSAGKDARTSVAVVPGRLYQLKLTPQGDVTLGQSGAKKTPAAGAFAGVAQLKITAPGKYRVSMDAAAWVDLLTQGGLAPVTDFEGLHGCDAPRKIVEFELLGTGPFVLQVSSSEQATIRVAVTASPVRKL